GERHEAHVPVGAVAERGDHVLVGVAGERAAVVPGDREGSHRRCERSRRAPHSRRGRVITRRSGRHRQRARPASGSGQTRRAIRASATPSSAPATTSEGWWIFTYTRLEATTAPSA